MNGVRPDSIADTSAIVRLCRRDPQVEQRLQGRNFAVSFVTMAELNLGILKADDPMAVAQRCLEVLAGHQVFGGSVKTPTLYATIYYDLEQRVVLLGNARVWQEDNVVSGETITIFLSQDRSVVQGGKQERVKAIFYPREGQGEAAGGRPAVKGPAPCAN